MQSAAGLWPTAFRWIDQQVTVRLRSPPASWRLMRVPPQDDAQQRTHRNATLSDLSLLRIRVLRAIRIQAIHASPMGLRPPGARRAL